MSDTTDPGGPDRVELELDVPRARALERLVTRTGFDSVGQLVEGWIEGATHLEEAAESSDVETETLVAYVDRDRWQAFVELWERDDGGQSPDGPEEAIEETLTLLGEQFLGEGKLGGPTAAGLPSAIPQGTALGSPDSFPDAAPEGLVSDVDITDFGVPQGPLRDDGRDDLTRLCIVPGCDEPAHAGALEDGYPLCKDDDNALSRQGYEAETLLDPTARRPFDGPVDGG